MSDDPVNFFLWLLKELELEVEGEEFNEILKEIFKFKVTDVTNKIKEAASQDAVFNERVMSFYSYHGSATANFIIVTDFFASLPSEVFDNASEVVMQEEIDSYVSRLIDSQ